MDEDLSNLIRRLRDETTFVQSEKKHLIELYNQLVKKSEKLFNKQWLISRQHLILDELIFGRNKSVKNQCTKFSLITNNHHFIESYKILGHNDYYVSEFLKSLRDKPQYLANLVLRSEKLNSGSFLNAIELIQGVDNQNFSPQLLIPIIFQSLYSNCVLVQDESLCLQLLKNLMENQFCSDDTLNMNIDLRKLIRKQSCSFNILFKMYTSFSYSAQLFLLTALHEPINQVLTDEWFLDIDPDKALARFSSEELINKFGQPNSKEYKIKTMRYREKIVTLLYNSTMLFIESISSSLYAFPPSMTWLVNQFFKSVSKNSRPNSTEIARKLACDLIMALYICPAICDPEPYGVISDVQISNVARHNLMQIANILQVLAMSDDDKDPKAQDLYSKFRSNCVSDIVNNIISPNGKSSSTGSLSSDPFDFCTTNNQALETPSNMSTVSSVTNSSTINQNLFLRTSVMISLNDLNRLLLFIRQLSKEPMLIETDESKWLKTIVPTDYINQALINCASTLNSNRKANLLNSESPEVITHLFKEPILEESYQILVININDKGFDCPGMLAEEKVLNDNDIYANNRILAKKNRLKPKINKQIDLDNSFEPSIKLQPEAPADRDDIRSRHDGSVGISEVCETTECHSISSNDDEDEAVDQNDVNQLENESLSSFDNFSGRDTPIISGRDTPSSHSHEDLQNISSSRNSNATSTIQNISNVNSLGNIVVNTTSSTTNTSRGPQLPVTVQKANREDINEKFCKFEINKINPAKEEQMSETGWSLDADAPESVSNEPINDIDDSSSSTSRYGPVIRNPTSSSLPVNNNNQNNLINFSEQDFSIINNIQNRNASSSNSLANNQINSSNANTNLSTAETDQNLDDRYSVVSDNAAWSTDMINNSDSDFESNSPSKYTPYSTYSSNCSSSHPPLNQSLINDFVQSTNQSNQITYGSNTSNTLPNNSNYSISYSSSTSSAINILALNTDLNKRSETKDSNLTFQNEPSQQQTNQSTTSNSSKNRISSIFSSNSNSVKFSLTSTFEKLSNGANSKKAGIHKFSLFNKSTKSPNPTNQTNDLFASLNPFSSTTDSANQAPGNSQSEDVDHILKKYQSKLPSQVPILQTQSSINEAQLIDISTTSSTQNTQNDNSSKKPAFENSLRVQQSILFEPNNLDQSKAFLDAKKKLRLVLSWPDCMSYNYAPNNNLKNSKDNFLVMYLKIQLYDSISLQDKEKEAQLYETIRCVSIYNDQECYKLLKSLKKDYTRRIYYMTYLTKSKQNVLYTLNLVDKLLQRAEWHQKLRTHHFASVVTLFFLETKENEQQIYKFINDFRHLVAVDEKYDLFKKYLQLLKKEYDVILTGCQEEMIQLCHLCLERLLLSKVYSYVMYPNGEIDHHRDNMVSECFNELANNLSPTHPSIGISPIYLNECPWTAAQMELKRLNIYRTPQDKLACIRKCMLTIQNLLAIAKSPVCADDLHPVLIYVIIKANPPTIISNVQYIEGFYGKQLELEDYYWAQFIFAFSYIKANMLNNKQ
ncbi:unnamed protein product [Brachionus calyciflorus]|uniref:Uncharacterized protein n=1 Tax=Brachionus calyciflorus TaxID=104777 RepID=A0A813TCX6_9BILA|nr:unnamed protein product [Brachionus calyciflorus]